MTPEERGRRYLRGVVEADAASTFPVSLTG
jgi:hypothetical protein